MTVLLVDDTACLLLDYEAIVEECGLACQLYADGDEVAPVLFTRPKDVVVICDVDMRRTKGTELLEWLVANRIQCPFLLHSASNKYHGRVLSDWVKCLSVGFGAELVFHEKIGSIPPDEYIPAFLRRNHPTLRREQHPFAAE